MKSRAANPVETVLEGSHRTWVLLAQTTLWVASVITAFLLPPPSAATASSQLWIRFAQFVITILIGVLLLGAIRWHRPKHVIRWAVLSLAALIAGSVAFFEYQILSVRWTVSYNQSPVIVGSRWTSEGRAYHEQHPNRSPEEVVMDFAGRLERIWTKESIEQRRWWLAAIYVLAMPMFTISIISIVQAVQCAVPKAKSRKASK